MQKKSVQILSIFLTTTLIFSLSSCKKNKTIHLKEENTIQYKTQILEKNITWTDGIDPEILEKNTKTNNGYEKNVKPSAANFYILSDSLKNEQVIPSMDGFTSLDTSTYPQQLFIIITNFSSQIKNNAVDGNYLQSDKLYSYVIFNHKLKQIIGENQIENCIIGQNIDMEDYQKCPVRLIYKNENDKTFYVDILIYTIKIKDMWKINKIEILKTGEIHG